MNEPTLTPEEADQLAAFLNQVCHVALEALQSGDASSHAAVAASLRALTAEFGAGSTIGDFLALLVAWLKGTPPTREQERALQTPFRRALRAMRREVGTTPPAPPPDPVSRHVLAQLVTATVAAVAAGDETLQGRLAAQLINIQNRLDEHGRRRLGPLLENLRAALGGADPRRLPPVEDEVYGRFWTSAVELLINADLTEEQAHDQLLQRLVHNTRFVLRARNEELSAGFLRSLAEVEAEARRTGAESVARLIAAIQARVRGEKTEALVAQLDGPEREAWAAIAKPETTTG